MRPVSAIALGTLTVGGLDLLDAIVFFGVRNSLSPERILQSIASGLLGRAAFAGGAATAMLGAGLQFFIAGCIVSSYYLASRRFRFLTSHVWVTGTLYGVIVYVFMNAVVLPLSAAPHGFPRTPVLINGLLIHILGVGIPAALFARAAGETRSGGKRQH